MTTNGIQCSVRCIAVTDAGEHEHGPSNFCCTVILHVLCLVAFLPFVETEVSE